MRRRLLFALAVHVAAVVDLVVTLVYVVARDYAAATFYSVWFLILLNWIEKALPNESDDA